MVTADFEDYWCAQDRVEERWRDAAGWWSAAVLNTSRVGWFSSDRAIREYAGEIWNVLPGAS
jgi:starch phosphorylase